MSNFLINSYVDFEVLFTDHNVPKDMSDVTCEIYHYRPALPAILEASIQEPYTITETISDTLQMISTNLVSGSAVITLSDITLDLVYIIDQLEGLECPPNDFVVCGTNTKVAIINGRKVYALSACELATLINLRAEGYLAYVSEGKVCFKTITEGQGTDIVLGAGTLNQVIGLVSGTSGLGTDLTVEVDKSGAMTYISTGKYVYPHVLIDNSFQIDQRYYVTYQGTNSNSEVEKIEENFVVSAPPSIGLRFSFS